jgi:hypothetical protein
VRRERLAFERDSARAQASWLRLSTNARQVFDYDEYRYYIQLDHRKSCLRRFAMCSRRSHFGLTGSRNDRRHNGQSAVEFTVSGDGAAETTGGAAGARP